MALAKERICQSPQTSFAQGIDPSSLEFHGFKSHHASLLQEGSLSESSHHSTLFDPGNISTGVGFMSSLPHEAQSAVNHWAAYSSSSSSVLSFEQPKINQDENCALWIDSMDHEYQARDGNCFDMTSDYGSIERQYSFQDGGELERSGSLKRSYMGGGDMQASKKQCGNNRKAKAKPSPSKDPQSIAAKNRRERISERLKVLQDLVPNGTKVDLVTMLEKAISYVKFLQLQVKVLATDEFWPAQGGKAPELSQVKEAIDAILSSHRDRSSSSKH